jgi:hypothetical protein
MNRTITALQPAPVAAAARPCDLGHGYAGGLMGFWVTKQVNNGSITAPARRLRGRPT